MVRTLIQGTALILTIESAILLARGSLVLTSKTMAEIARTKVGYNLDVAKSMATQQADTRVGAGLLFVAFALQMANALWALTWDDFEVSYGGWALAMLASVIAWVASRQISDHLATQAISEVRRILQPRDEVERISE